MPDISKNHEISGLPIYHGPKPSDKIKFSDTLPHDFSPIHMLLNCLFIFCMRPHVGQDRDHQSWRVENPVQNHQFGAKTFLTCTILADTTQKDAKFQPGPSIIPFHSKNTKALTSDEAWIGRDCKLYLQKR